MATVTAPVASVAETCRAAQAAARALATLDTAAKDRALEAIAASLEARTDEILDANALDLEAGRAAGLTPALLDRLALDERRIAAMAAGVRTIAALPDPVGEVVEGRRLPNGLDVRKVRVPLGVVAVVYEARPNVTIDAAALCLKSGNAVCCAGPRRPRTRTPCSPRSPARRPRPRGCRRARSRSWPAAAGRSSPSSRPRPASSTSSSRAAARA